MQEITNEILKVFEDLQRMQFKKEQNSTDEGEKDRYGYPFEPCDAFSTKPLEFAETALRLDIEAREMFSQLCKLNRHSPLFYRLSGQFEKILSLLGSCCITKAVIEQQENDTFELLQDLTIDSLREMAAFQFRKCSAAFMDSRSCGRINLEAFNLSVRWAALDKRLIATEEKIRSGRWSVAGGQKSAEESTQYPVSGTQNEAPVAGEQLPEADDHSTGKLPVSAFAEKGRAFRVIGEIRDQKSDIRNDLSSRQSTKETVVVDAETSLQNCPDRPGSRNNEDRDQSTQYPVLRDLKDLTVDGENGGNGDGSLRHRSVPAGSRPHRHHPVVSGDRTHYQEENDAGKLPVRGFSEEGEKQYMRDILTGEALDRGDRKAYEAVLQASDPELEVLWREFLLRETKNGFAFLEKIGLFGDEPEDPPPEDEWSGLLEPTSVLN